MTENYISEEDKKYIEKVRQKFNKIGNKLAGTLFSDNWFVNPNSTLLQPFLQENILKSQLQKYAETKHQKIREIIFNHMMWFAIYVISFKFKSYYILCNDFEEYISFALERLWMCIDEYDESCGATFDTFYINDVTFRFHRYIHHMYNPDLCLTDSIRIRVATATARIVEDDISFQDIMKMNPEYFYMRYHFDKLSYIQAITMSNIKSFEDIFINDDVDFDAVSKVSDPRSNFELGIDQKIFTNQICDIVRSRYAKKERDYLIWREYVVNGDSSLQSVGNMFGMTRERVRQIVDKINLKLRNNTLIKDAHKMYD